MLFTNNELIKWINNYKNSDFFECDKNKLDCGIYHVLSPILQNIGFFKNYELYKDYIREAIISTYRLNKRTNILVAGLASEESAVAFCNIIKSLDIYPSITFIDLCSTPLKRSKHRLENFRKAKLNFIKQNLLNININKLNIHSKYNLIVADSFITKFSPFKKKIILSNFKKYSYHSSKIILREYCGKLNLLLDKFWDKLPPILEKSSLYNLANTKSKINLHDMLKEMKKYMLNVGYPFESKKSLFQMLNSVNFNVNSCNNPKNSNSYVITGNFN